MPHSNEVPELPDNVISLMEKLHHDENPSLNDITTGVDQGNVTYVVDAASGTEDNPVDGIEILVNLAKSGKIDPWNVDIVQVTDEYLKALKDLTVLNLKLTGKTLLMAAILLRMKSDQLSGINYLDLGPGIEDADFGEDADWHEMQMNGSPYGDGVHSPFEVIKTMTLEALNGLFGKLDKTLDRRTSTKAHRKRRVTLDDLIREFQVYEEIERRRALHEAVEKVDKRRQRRQNYENLSAEEIVELAHDEFIEETVMDVRACLAGMWVDDERVSLRQLFSQLEMIDRVSIYVAILFLTSRGQASLDQKEFYGELYILPQPKDDHLEGEDNSSVIEMHTVADELEEVS